MKKILTTGGTMSLVFATMQPVRRISLIDQTAEQLRQAVRGGRWSERLPGVLRLAAECDVSTRVVRAALRQIEAEGLISGQGPGRSRGIAAPL